MARYYRVVRNCARAVKVKQELSEQAFENCVWEEANDLAWEDVWDMPNNDDKMIAQEDRCAQYCDAIRSAAETIVAEYEEDEDSYYMRIEGGIDIGDYTYYIVTDDRITEYDLPRRN